MSRGYARWFAALAATLAVGWILFWALGEKVAAIVAGKFGDVLARISDGKFSDPVVFVHGRMAEMMFLLTVAAVLWLATVAIITRIGRMEKSRMLHGLFHAVVLFVAINVFAWCCGRTAIFWTVFYSKTRVDNLAQYHIKRTLMKESSVPQRAILLGNSQTNRSIDERVLNSILGKTLWTTELTQAGARGFDMLTLSRDIPLRKGDKVICYLSEISFYGRGSGIVAADFFNFSEIPVLTELDGWRFLAPGAALNGLAGRTIPLYRYRNSISNRFLGSDLVDLGQRMHDASLQVNLDELAARQASKLGPGEGAEFEKAAFSRMCRELDAKGCGFIIVTGDVHPALRRHLDPKVSSDMREFLADLSGTYPETVTIIRGDELLEPTSATFSDLVHFTDGAQLEFTRALALSLQAGLHDNTSGN